MSIPQVIAISKCTSGMSINLKKDVESSIGKGAGDLSLYKQKEFLLGRHPGSNAVSTKVIGKKLTFPPEVVSTLRIGPGSLVAMVEREGAVALKRCVTEMREGELGGIYDEEDNVLLRRVVEKAPQPDALLPVLTDSLKHCSLQFSPRDFFEKIDTFEGWVARGLLGVENADDELIRERLVSDRFASQDDDGSWRGDLMVTARILRELRLLGLDKNHTDIGRAIAWMLARLESDANPGMFFLVDDLVDLQRSILQERERTGKGRFRDLRAGEMKRVCAADPLIQRPCGPRIMWPTALSLEALLSYGMENHPRLARALETLSSGGWCECGYQLGRNLRRDESENRVEQFEDNCRNEYLMCGLHDLKDLEGMVMSKKYGLRMPRISVSNVNGSTVYGIKREAHIQGCEAVTVRGVFLAKHNTIRRLANAHLWSFLSRQDPKTGQFQEEKHGYCRNSPFSLLDVFSRYDHPAARIATLRLVPWILSHQNHDGSWGQEETKGADTLAVIRGLLKAKEHLPEDLVLSR